MQTSAIARRFEVGFRDFDELLMGRSQRTRQRIGTERRGQIRREWSFKVAVYTQWLQSGIEFGISPGSQCSFLNNIVSLKFPHGD